MSDIFQEIDEELRRENLLQLWRRYGKYVVVLAAVAVAATALAVGWREYRLRERQAEGVRYAAALDLMRQGKDKDAAAAFAALAQNSSSGRAVLAQFEEASLKSKAGDRDGAEAIYDQIAKDGGAGDIYRELATLMAARLEVDNEPKQAIQRLQPLTAADKPFHATALELSAIAQIKEGDSKAALQTYQHLSDDPGVPSGARARAAEMVQALSQ